VPVQAKKQETEEAAISEENRPSPDHETEDWSKQRVVQEDEEERL
jgi:hypothetical protein